MSASDDRRIHLDPEILGPEETREERIRERLWSTVKRAARSIPFMEDVVAAWYCALDPATPTRVRAVLLAALAYFVAPIDVMPDLLPLVGFGDDAGVLMAAITLLRAHITDDHREAARKAMAEH
ncbi:MAG: YkvA family protein [Siculibacillus sp.]|nr:YkvA family protein [Siculibacillus sp.]